MLALFDQVESGHCDSINISDYCDGTVFHSHSLFSVKSSALQLFFYFDDLEVCNPLGSRTKTHKLSKSSVPMFISTVTLYII